MTCAGQGWIRLAWFQLVLMALIFLSAGSLRYWQGWSYWLTCLVAFGGISLGRAEQPGPPAGGGWRPARAPRLAPRRRP